MKILVVGGGSGGRVSSSGKVRLWRALGLPPGFVRLVLGEGLSGLWPLRVVEAGEIYGLGHTAGGLVWWLRRVSEVQRRLIGVSFMWMEWSAASFTWDW